MMQAKDLPDVDTLLVVEAAQAGRLAHWDGAVGYKRWAHNTDVEKRFPAAHARVVLAKMKALLRRGLITGCACGCCGDYELTDKGREFLGRPS